MMTNLFYILLWFFVSIIIGLIIIIYIYHRALTQSRKETGDLLKVTKGYIILVDSLPPLSAISGTLRPNYDKLMYVIKKIEGEK